MWSDVNYEPGELMAISYKEGELTGEARMITAGKPYTLKLTTDRQVIQRGGMDLAYVTIEAIDQNGNTCPLADDQVEITLEGKGTIAGVGNGNPQSIEPFQSNRVRLFYGKAMLILRSTPESGSIQVTASAKELNKAVTTITVE
jgi:beta-galactosidase